MPKAIILTGEANRLIVSFYFLAKPQSTQSKKTGVRIKTIWL